jgi:hypothetical protein
VCRHEGLDLERAFVEAAAAVALARNGLLDQARRLMAGWSRVPAASLARAYRDLARADVAALEERHGAVLAVARRAVAFFRACGNAPIECYLRLLVAVAAAPADAADALADYRAATHRLQIPQHLRQLRVLEALARRRTCRPGAVWLVERSRSGARTVGALRLLTPPAEALGADLYWDDIQRRLYVRGQGPRRFERETVLESALRALLRAPSFRASLARLHREVWRRPYDPLRHEDKISVTVHRLRSWLARSAPVARDFVRVRTGALALDPRLDVRVLELPGRCRRPATRQMEPAACLLECLSASGPLTRGRLEQHLGFSRAAVGRLLRALVARGLVTPQGSGRARSYAASTARAAGTPCRARARGGRVSPSRPRSRDSRRPICSLV